MVHNSNRHDYNGLRYVVLLAAIASFLGSLGLLGFQAIMFLKTGYWTGISCLDALRWLDVNWATAPTDWFGVHRALGFVPLFIGMWLSAIAIGWAAVTWGSNES